MDTFVCQRGHSTHATTVWHVDLAEPHTYSDLAPIPARLARAFDFEVYDPARYPVDGGPYCPAHDVVGETVVNCGIWEPNETILTLAVLASKPGRFVDFGAHIGWYTVLALLAGCTVEAFEADPDNLLMLARNAAHQNRAPKLTVHPDVVGPTSPTLPPWSVRLAKLDLEGAEPHALRMLWPSIKQRRVDHLCIEVTPKWAPEMARLIPEVVDLGYEPFVVPDKRIPPWPLERLPDDMAAHRLERAGLTAEIDQWDQTQVWLHREGAPW